MQKEDSNTKTSFQYIQLGANEIILERELVENNHLLFLIGGEIEVVYGSLNPRIISAGNMILLSSLANCECRTLTEVRFILLEFNHFNITCDRLIFQNLAPIFTLIKYEFQELEIRPSLVLYLELIEEYLKIVNLPREIWNEKVKELGILLKTYYDSEELTMLFYPLLGVNMDFKKKIVDNYNKVKNATEYAELCGYSLGVFQRKFKEVFGMTVYQWMQSQKAEQIKHRLMVTDINPKVLADEFEFASPAHLNKFCKIWFGMTPTELRQTYLLKKNLK